MSVVKGKRNQSKVEFEMIYFQLVDNIDNLLEHDFYAEGDFALKNKTFLNIRYQSLERLTDDLLYHIINRDIERDDLKLMFNNKNRRLNYE